MSHATLTGEDTIVARSIPLYFSGIAAAREMAGAAAPPYRKPARKTGPKPGTKSVQARARAWSRHRVIQELRDLYSSGQTTSLPELLAAGKATLVHAAQVYVGGLQRARKLAGIPVPTRRIEKKHTWTAKSIVRAIRARRRRGDSLAASQAPLSLYAAAGRHFGGWANALASAGIEPNSARASVKRYTKPVIIERLRRAAREGSDLRSKNLARVLDLKAVNREFGTLQAAIRAAGLEKTLERRRHGGTKRDRGTVIAVLRERAARGILTFTPGLRRAVQIYLGGAREARRAAGVPDPVDRAIAQRRKAAQAFTARHARRRKRRRLPTDSTSPRSP